MSALPTAWRWRLVGVLSAVSILLYLLVLSSDDVLPAAPYEKAGGRFRSAPGKPRRIPEETLRSLSLTEEQCNATFPRLTEDIDRTVALGPPHPGRKRKESQRPLWCTLALLVRCEGEHESVADYGIDQLYIVNWEPRGTLSPQLLEVRFLRIPRPLPTSTSPLACGLRAKTPPTHPASPVPSPEPHPSTRSTAPSSPRPSPSPTPSSPSTCRTSPSAPPGPTPGPPTPRPPSTCPPSCAPS
ncbi:hypothetical protein VTK73DRAFT_2553 [Phialemonium thermophilum]|uniref:Uncharacterized protein n=1 Tax=Phialemonium thermophilum TaxID=223376 RepID=A0ABR3VS09_9PEZI